MSSLSISCSSHTLPLLFRKQHTEMERKLKDLSSKVIVGGVNLLEKAEHQQRLLEESAREMTKRKKKEAKLTKQLRKYNPPHVWPASRVRVSWFTQEGG